MADPQALRQALIARQMKLAPEEPEEYDPEVMAQFAENQPIPEMPRGAQPDADLNFPGAAMVDPAVQLEMERAKIKEMLKRTRMKEIDMETDMIRNQRMADVENEANELFAPQGKKKSGY